MALFRAHPTNRTHPNLGYRLEVLLRFMSVRCRRELQRIGLRAVVDAFGNDIEILHDAEAEAHKVVRFKGKLLEDLIRQHSDKAPLGQHPDTFH